MDTANPTEKKASTESAPEIQESEIRKSFRNKLLNKSVKITLLDNRRIFGKLTCIDNKKNVVVLDAVEEIPAEYIAQINEHLPILSRSTMKIQNYVNLAKEITDDQEKVKSLDKEFFKNKFYLGQAIIPGHSISKIEIQTISV